MPDKRTDRFDRLVEPLERTMVQAELSMMDMKARTQNLGQEHQDAPPPVQ